MPKLVRFLGLPVDLPDGSTTSWVTLTRTGSFTDPRYGRFPITAEMLLQMVSNFEARVVGQDVFIDVAHKPSDGAAAKVLKLAIEGQRLRALLAWTPFGIDAVKGRGFAYLSAEFHEDWRDNEKGEAHGCVLLGAGLTTRPVIKHLDPVQLSTDDDPEDGHRVAMHPNLLKSLEQPTMNYLAQLKAKLLAQGLTIEQITPLLAEAEKQLAASKDDEAKCLSIVSTFEGAGQALSAELKKLSGGTGGSVTLQMSTGLSAADVQAAVAKALSDQAAAAAATKTAQDAKVKILSDLVEADTGLSADTRTLIVKEASTLLSADMTDDQVKRLGEFVLKQAGSASAAVQLATLGFAPASGSLHITVDPPQDIKALQVEMDKRLGIDSWAPSRRFERTGGKLLEENKAFAERALADFDKVNGARLLQEHAQLKGTRSLAAGTTGISDTAVPVAFERTVLREQLYQTVNVALCDVGTYPFNNVITIPYSYRDTSGAGPGDVRVYEGQGIKRGSVIETTEEARPIPQKLAFRITNEVRYLLAASAIDYDPVAENIRNLIRIVSEDTDRIIGNELLNGSDEYLAATFTDTLTSQVNGTNGVFVTANWPVVRPRRIYDLKGAQQGNTLNPVTVTLGGTARSEYAPGVSAGTYWVLDYNLGELRFVDQTGAAVIPSNGTALVVTGSRVTNVAKADIYPGTNSPTLAQTQQVYDALLFLIGARKVVIENDRYYNANTMVLSGAIDNALSQASTFQANSTRPGTGLNPDGSVGTVKGIPTWNTKAPGLQVGDTRILIGERGNTRFRMVRPWSMQPDMQQVRDTNGNFTGATENYGEQWIAAHTPTLRRNAQTSLVLYNSNARVARVS